MHINDLDLFISVLKCEDLLIHTNETTIRPKYFKNMFGAPFCFK